jgi:hypothetical protein
MGSTHLPPTYDPREEPGALAAPAGICAGGGEKSPSATIGPRSRANSSRIASERFRSVPRTPDLPAGTLNQLRRGPVGGMIACGPGGGRNPLLA